MELTNEQQNAIDALFSTRSNLFIITGRPGTGKTTLAAWIVQHYLSEGMQVELCAPTGRAAKRLSEKTSYPAATIHRLLEFDPFLTAFKRNELNTLQADVVICDESSMVDVFLMESLLRALKPTTRLVLVGDPYQLPPVGPGMPFRDIINSGTIPCSELRTIHRQCAGNAIICAAHGVLDGDLSSISWDGERLDLQLVDMGREVSEQDIVTYIKDEVSRSPFKYHVESDDVQILCPQRTSSAISTGIFNDTIKEMLNPPSYNKLEVEGFREGDRIIQLRNNYKLGIFNGDLGRVMDVITEKRRAAMHAPKGTILRVAFNGSVLDLSPDDVKDLALAYALTIHKSQGSEYPLVFIPCHRANTWMWTRPLLYTALTRAQKYCAIVGDLAVMAGAVHNTREDRRRTSLVRRLRRL